MRGDQAFCPAFTKAPHLHFTWGEASEVKPGTRASAGI